METQIKEFALTGNGELIHAAITTRAAGPFKCICCESEVILKSGSERRPHFAHKHDNATEGCGESYEHDLAKRLMAKYFTLTQCHIRCADCNQIWESPTEVFDFSKNPGLKSAVEFKVNVNNRTYFLDVAILDDRNQLVAAVEIYHMHAVPEPKWVDISNLCPLLQIPADQILDAFSTIVGTTPLHTEIILKPQKPRYCRDCGFRRRRPCWSCDQWVDPENLRTLKCLPPGCEYPKAFVCKSCCAFCTNCYGVIEQPWKLCRECYRSLEMHDHQCERCRGYDATGTRFGLRHCRCRCDPIFTSFCNSLTSPE